MPFHSFALADINITSMILDFLLYPHILSHHLSIALYLVIFLFSSISRFLWLIFESFIFFYLFFVYIFSKDLSVYWYYLDSPILSILSFFLFVTSFLIFLGIEMDGADCWTITDAALISDICTPVIATPLNIHLSRLRSLMAVWNRKLRWVPSRQTSFILPRHYWPLTLHCRAYNSSFLA